MSRVDLSRFTTEELNDFLWRSGQIGAVLRDGKALLHDGQKELSDIFHAAPGRKFVANCSRRWGKSWWLCVESVKVALSKPKRMVRYAAPTIKMVRNIIEPHLNEILSTCPRDLKPRWYRQDGILRFKNASEIHVAGCDNQGAERLRGTDTHFGPIDEAGLIPDLEYVVQDILLPQTLTTDGRILMASTPPKTPGHPFRQFFVEAQSEGRALHKTIYDAPHIPKHVIQEFIEESGGEHTSTWKREYLAQFVVDDELAIVPEWTEHNLCQEYPAPIHADWYVAMDVGYSDLTVALLAFYDFVTATVYVIDEVVMNQSNSKQIDEALAIRERETFEGEPRVRVVDAPQLVLADLRSHANRSYIAARKDDKDAALNDLRVKVQQGKFRVFGIRGPGGNIIKGCPTLIAHMENGIWNKAKSSFERSGTYGHFDAIDAAKYLVRHVDWHSNPYTKWKPHSEVYHYRPEPEEDNSVLSIVKPRYRR